MMNRTSSAKIDDAVARTQALIADQQALIDALDSEGRDSSRHREFLESFRRLLAVQEGWRQKAASSRNPDRPNGVMAWSPRITPAGRREVA
jgi:hypothetical protein